MAINKVATAVLGFLGGGGSLYSNLWAVKNMDEDLFCFLFLNNLYDKILRNLFDKTIFDEDLSLKTFYDCPVDGQMSEGFITKLRVALASNSRLALKYDYVSDTLHILKGKYEDEPLTCGFDFSYLKDINIALMYYAQQLFLLSKATNIKILNATSLLIYLKGLSDNISSNKINAINKQVDSLVRNINNGGAGVLDSESRVESGVIDVSGIKDGGKYIMEQVSLLIKYSVNFLTGESTTGLGSTGEQDQEKDFKSLSISFREFWQPIIEKLYNTEIQLKIDKWQLSDTHRSYMDWIETNNLLPREVKQEIVADILESNGLIDSKQAEVIKNYVKNDDTI